MAVIMDLQERGREREGGRAKDAEPREDEGPGRDGDAARQRAPRISDQPGGAQRCAPGRGCPAAALTPAGAGGEGRAGRAPGAAAGSGDSWCPSPRAPLPPESGEDSEDPVAATSAPRGGQRAPRALGNRDKNSGPV